MFWPKSTGVPSDDLGPSFGIIFSPKFQNPTMLVNHVHVIVGKNPQTHENITFRASLKPPQAPELSWVLRPKVPYRHPNQFGYFAQKSPQAPELI